MKKQFIILALLSCFIYTSESNADEDVEVGNNLREQNDRYKARYYYQSALIKNKNNIDALYQLAKMDYEITDYKNAMRYLDTLLEIDNGYIQALILRSTIFIKQQQWDNALVDLEIAEQQDTENATVQMLLESIFSMKGNTKKAEEHAKNHERLRIIEIQKQASGSNE